MAYTRRAPATEPQEHLALRVTRTLPLGFCAARHLCVETRYGTQRRCARKCARMEAQRVRKSASTFAPRATNSATLQQLGETRHFLLGLANQVLSQLSYRPERATR